MTVRPHAAALIAPGHRTRLTALLAVAVLVLTALVLVPAAPSLAGSGGTMLKPGEMLRGGQSIVNGQYRLSMQSDGNAVVYASGGRVRWQSRTNGHAGARLAMQTDGNAVVYAANGKALWNSRTQGNSGSRLVIQTDGNLVVYRRDNRALWHIGPDSPIKTVDPSGLYAIRSGLAKDSCGDVTSFARQMATKKTIYHGGNGWNGQIVAVGADSGQLVQAWRNSPPHATLAADGQWSRMAAGAARGTDGRMYGVVNFCR